MREGDRRTEAVSAGHVLLVLPGATGSALVTEVDVNGAPLGEPVTVQGVLQRFGPFTDDKAFYVETTASHVVAHVLTLDELRTINDARFFSGAGVPTDGAGGTGAGWAMRGSLYSDVLGGKLYINGGTRVNPVWKLITSAP